MPEPIMKQASFRTQVPSTTELALPLATPMDTTPSGEAEPPSTSISISSPTSSVTSTSIPPTTHGGRRRQPNVVERKFNFDFLTSPRRKLYHDWLPKVSVISKRAVATLSNVCPRLPEASASTVQEQLSPSAPSHPTPPNLKLTPPELTLSNSPPSPEAMSDSPTDLPSTETEDSPSTFHNFYQRASMLTSPFPSKLHIRSMDEDEDLAVIDQVNRRLALGQLEPSLPWIPVPPGAGLLGYPPPTTEQYSESFAEAAFQHQQQEMMSSMMATAAASLQGGQCFFPMETTHPTASGESVQFNLVSSVHNRPFGTPHFYILVSIRKWYGWKDVALSLHVLISVEKSTSEVFLQAYKTREICFPDVLNQITSTTAKMPNPARLFTIHPGEEVQLLEFARKIWAVGQAHPTLRIFFPERVHIWPHEFFIDPRAMHNFRLLLKILKVRSNKSVASNTDELMCRGIRDLKLFSLDSQQPPFADAFSSSDVEDLKLNELDGNVAMNDTCYLHKRPPLSSPPG
ncbi:unnamed protein product [Taenia asiatica]|uniref:SH2 domain-containing protein n=1 Tax=Taenia asiatica TaxID=60517 RepID=A0A0R3WG45_TAEAS|nr:unnamed protein product [Taenia asiatica]